MRKFKIINIQAREILDSKAEPTIEVELQSDFGVFFASVPSGVSKGTYEAKELRDNEKRYQGKGVLKAVRNVNKIISPKLKGKNLINQKEIDDIMIKIDSTKHKSQLGANAILSVSIAVCRAGAAAMNIPLYEHISKLKKNNSKTILPDPCFLMIEGGLHAGSKLDIQEFMIKPNENSFTKNIELGSLVYQNLKKILEKECSKSSINVGLEGGFTPNLRNSEEVLDLIIKAIKKSNFKNIGIILDCAASTFYSKGIYRFEGKKFTRNKLLNFYSGLIKKYPIIGIEDPFSENDWKGFKDFTELVKIKNNSICSKFSNVSVIGDDLTVTNLDRVKKAVKEQSCNALIIKPNQIGTVSQTIEVVEYAKKNNLKIFVKHRSGETNDDFIADLSVGLNADGIMAGAPARGERGAKYNRLLKIEQDIKKNN